MVKKDTEITFEENLKKLENIVDQLESGNIDLDRYGKGYNPDILFNKCVNKIVYETSHTRRIDFVSLKLNWKQIFSTKE